MRNNKILAAAMAATLSIMGQAYAMDILNYECSGADTCSATLGGTAYDLIKVPSEGVSYGTHLFGSDGGNLTLPDERKAVVQYTVEGSIGFTFDFDVEITNGAEFADDPILVFEAAAGSNGVAGIDTETLTPNATGIGNCGGDSSCSWTVNVGDSDLENGDNFYLIYNLAAASALKTAGETIGISASLGSTLGGKIATALSITVAQSGDPLSVTIEPGSESGTRISVSSNNTEFSSTNSSTVEVLTVNEAVIGYIKIENNSNVVAANGYSPWILGNTDENNGGSPSFDAGFDADNGIETTLTITSGQFNASMTGSSGSVYLALDGCCEADGSIDNGVKIPATSVTSTDATWELSNANLEALTTASANGQPAIVIETDGSNAVNIEENPPEATLVLDYADGQQDVAYPTVELSSFRQDGTTCWVYNVPPPSTEGVADELNLRITNDSTSISGTILGTMYPMTGGDADPIFTSINLLGEEVELGAGETVRLTADALSALGGDTPYTWWADGARRGMLYISSTLPKLEILVLLRDTNTGILSSVSIGAHGSACQN